MVTGKQEEQEHRGNKGATGEQGNRKTANRGTRVQGNREPRNKETREQSVTISHSTTMLQKFLKTGDLDTIA